MSMTKIEAIDQGSPAQRSGVRVGESLKAVSGHPIVDVLDYKFYTYNPRLLLTLTGEDGSSRLVLVKKRPGEELGLNFQRYLMDAARSCANRCIFCFVDQLPKGLRDTLYFKDDDARLSFLMGNYITLTNLSQRELQRIIDLRISPINVSVHATNPELRAMLLGNKNGGAGYSIMERFAAAGIVMNCQIVACPGLNDGPELERSMRELGALYPGVNSVSIVPVGLTKYREGLYPLEAYTQAQARAVVEQAEAYGRVCKKRHGTTLFWCSDEFYLKAQLPLPEDAYFEGYTQLENGVGMLRSLLTEFADALEQGPPPPDVAPFSIATGVSAAPFLRQIVDMAAGKCHTVAGSVYPICNRFLGERINVAGLITGADLVEQLRGQALGQRLLLPVNMLRHGADVFLDDMTLQQVSQALGVPVVPVNQDGWALYQAIFATQRP